MIGQPLVGLSGISRVRRCLPLLSVLFFSSCTLERRFEESADTTAVVPSEASELQSTEELAGQTVRLFRDAVFAGDISRALSLMAEGASLIDPFAGRSTVEWPVGEVLLELRRRHADGVRFEPIRDEVTLLEDGGALVLTTLAVLQETGGVGEEVGEIHETALLIPSPEGWKVRHIHRSLVEAEP